MTSPVTILLVEDNDVDVEAAQRIFKKHRLANPIVVARDGRDALDHLQGVNGSPRLGRPYVILLDLNMPRMDGFEFLATLRSDPEISDSTVYVLTTSDRDEDKSATEEFRIAGYIVKTELESAISMISSSTIRDASK